MFTVPAPLSEAGAGMIAGIIIAVIIVIIIIIIIIVIFIRRKRQKKGRPNFPISTGENLQLTPRKPTLSLPLVLFTPSSVYPQ